MKYLNCGDCAQVFHDDTIIFKEYFNETENQYRLKYSVFNILKEIHNPHFIEIYDVYTKNSSLRSFLGGPKFFRVDAYTAKYYVKDNINVLDMNVDYILDNCRELEILFDTFSENGIITNDVKEENSVLDSERIVIIDPDLFLISNTKVCEVIKENKNNLYYLLDEIFYIAAINKRNEFSDYRRFDEFLRRVSNFFEDIIITHDTCVTSEISKRLQMVKKPIDLFYK